MTTTGRDVAKLAALVAGGAAVGAGLGLLYAPQSGVETRRQIRHYTKKAQIRATRFGRSMKAELNRAVDYGKSFVTKQEHGRPVRAA